jgi:hypothetical protein
MIILVERGPSAQGVKDYHSGIAKRISAILHGLNGVVASRVGLKRRGHPGRYEPQ